MAGMLVRIPDRIRQGEVIEIKVMVAHPMETGYRHTTLGQPIPRNILRRFSCLLDGEEIFSAELHPAVSANPYLVFPLRATASGTLRFAWSGDQELVATHEVRLEVE